jgi:hypothetical protein
LRTGAIVALNSPALSLVWLVWPAADEVAGALEDELVEELPPQPDSATSVATIAALQVIHDLGLARQSPTARI